MLLCTAEQMRELDRAAIEDFGIAGLVLMEAAGRGVADLVESLVDPKDSALSLPASVAIVCGAGNNAGDGFVAARHLINRGVSVRTCCLASRERLQGDAKVNLEALERLEPDIQWIDSGDSLKQMCMDLGGSAVVVDALLGTGLRSDVEGRFAAAIECINQLDSITVAVDIPSGLDADSGRIRGIAVRADHTVTFGYPKLGLVTYPGAEYVGQLSVVDIGLPRVLEQKKSFVARLLDDRFVRTRLRGRPASGHKGTFGHLLVLGGAAGKSGAVLMSAEAALRTGAGLCTVAAPSEILAALESKTREVMLQPASPAGTELDDSDSAFKHLNGLLAGKQAVAVGPGMPTGSGVRRLMARLVRESWLPLVIDADGLNALAGQVEVLRDKSAPCLLTPHPGEMARLLGCKTDEIQGNRVEVARRFAEQNEVYVVLKGWRTVIATPAGEVYICPVGNAGMATAGTGDVLTGIIGSLIAQGHSLQDAALIGVFVHGRAGDTAAAAKGARSLLASDVIAHIGSVFREWDA